MEKKVSKEIDVIDILKRVFIEWRLLIKVIAIAAIIGIVIALNTEKSTRQQLFWHQNYLLDHKWVLVYQA